MKITQIKQQIKNETRVSVFIDEKYSFSLTLDQLLDEKLKKGDEIDDRRVEDLKKLSDEGKLRARALDWVMGRPHSTKELKEYLYRKKATPEYIETLVEEFTGKKYIDDLNFARWFAEGRIRKNKSARAIRSELMAKGVSTVIAQNILAELETNDNNALFKLVNKLSSRPRYADQPRLIRYLMGKGFKYSEVMDAINKNTEITQ